MEAWLKAHVLLIVLTVGTVFDVIWFLRHEKELTMRWYQAIPAAICHTIWGVLCVTGFAFMESGFNPESLGNMSLYGGVFFMPVYYYALAKILKVKVSTVFDCCTICMLFTLMCARVNCLAAGCCRGLVIPGTDVRWPVRETEMLFYIIMMFVIAGKLKKGNTDGKVYPVYMMAYGIFRFILECFRTYDGSSVMHPAHFWSILSFCLGCSIYMQIRSRERKGKTGKY